MEWPHIMTAMVTPFNAQEQLDEERAVAIARWLITHGSDALVVAGTTGESATLTIEEREQLFRAVREGVGPDIPLFMGTGSNNTAQARQFSRQAESWGADGVLVVTPYYNKPTQEGLYHHFVRIAEDLTIPVMLYNVPGRTGVNLTAETVARIASTAPQVVGIKEAAGQLASLERLAAQCPQLKIYTGDDALYFPGLASGVSGVVSVAAHVVGNAMQQMRRLMQEGEWERARELNRKLLPIFHGLFELPNPIPVKWLLNRMGLEAGPLRLPLIFPQDAGELARLEQLHQMIERIEDDRRQTIGGEDESNQCAC